jgi:cytochrome c oxidase subunit II
VLAPGLALGLAGCGGNGQDALHPYSHPARDIASLWWWMLGGSALGLALVVGLLAAAWARRKRSTPDDDPKPGERAGWIVVIGLGVVMPVAVVASLFVIADIFVIGTTQAPAASSTAMTIDVVAHQWWWEVRYPGSEAVTANEIHIPIGTRVNLVATTADVIHSFWVPELNRKVDTIPGQRNRVLLYTDTPGVYRGQCTEYCGLQHAHMSLEVVAQSPAAFARWLAGQAAPARAPTTALERAGRRLFLGGACQSCHTIRGTTASGNVGPDLTHVGGRSTLAALTIPNTPAELSRWIDDSQSIKPGNQMPDFDYPPAQLRALAAYVGSLK